MPPQQLMPHRQSDLASTIQTGGLATGLGRHSLGRSRRAPTGRAVAVDGDGDDCVDGHAREMR